MSELEDIQAQIQAKEEAKKPFEIEIGRIDKEIELLREKRNRLISPYRLMWLEPNGESFEYYSDDEYKWMLWKLHHQIENRGTFGLHYHSIDETHYEANNEQGHWKMWLEKNPYCIEKAHHET